MGRLILVLAVAGAACGTSGTSGAGRTGVTPVSVAPGSYRAAHGTLVVDPDGRTVRMTSDGGSATIFGMLEGTVVRSPEGDVCGGFTLVVAKPGTLHLVWAPEMTGSAARADDVAAACRTNEGDYTRNEARQ